MDSALKTCVALALSLGQTTSAAECTMKPRITGLVDGDTPGTDGLPKLVQILFPCPVPEADFDKYSVSVYRAGSTTKVEGSTVHMLMSDPGFVYVSADSKHFKEFIGKDPDFVNENFFPTGNDSVELSYDGRPFDVYGAPSATAEERAAWNYAQGTAERIFGTEPSTEGNASSWYIKKGIVKNNAAITESGSGLVQFQGCENYPCPGGRRMNDSGQCYRALCTEEDCTTCCSADACISTAERVDELERNESAPIADCGQISCPPGYVIRDNAASIECAGGECSQEDLDTCCFLAIVRRRSAEQDIVELKASVFGTNLRLGPVSGALTLLVLVGAVIATASVATFRQSQAAHHGHDSEQLRTLAVSEGCED